MQGPVVFFKKCKFILHFCQYACLYRSIMIVVPLTSVPVSLQSQARLPPGQTLQSLQLEEHPFTFMWPQEREVISGEDILYFVRLPAVRQRRGTYCRKTVCRVCPHHYILLKATHTTANYHARTLRHVGIEPPAIDIYTYFHPQKNPNRNHVVFTLKWEKVLSHCFTSSQITSLEKV